MTGTATGIRDASSAARSGDGKFDYEVIGIGAGFAGLCMVHYFREAGLSLRVFDRAPDIGGTWAWNHYPGAATDSESYY